MAMYLNYEVVRRTKKQTTDGVSVVDVKRVINTEVNCSKFQTISEV